MRRIILGFFMLIGFTGIMNAQMSGELGVNFNSLNNFGLRYLYNMDDVYLRFTALSLNSSTQISDFDSQNERKDRNNGVGLRLGVEMRSGLVNNTDMCSIV